MDTGVEAGLRYSEAEVVEARLRRVEVDLVSRLKNLDRVATIQFNRMAAGARTAASRTRRRSIRRSFGAGGICSWNEAALGAG